MGDGGRNPHRWAGKSCPFQRETSCYVFDGGSTMMMLNVPRLLSCNAINKIMILYQLGLRSLGADRRQTLCEGER